MSLDHLRTEVLRLIAEGEDYLRDKHGLEPYNRSVMRRYARWQAGCQNLMRMLGDCAESWASNFSMSYGHAIPDTMIGTLQHIEFALGHGLLVNVEDIIRAEAFGSLLDQAEYLYKQRYFLAAGVLARAVLEEHLRAWTVQASLVITKDKPTINDFKDALYKVKKFSVSVMKHVEAMAAVGNDAAHYKPELKLDDVGRLVRDVRDFVGRHP